MTRKYANANPRDVREELQASLQEAHRLVFLHTMLDTLQAAATLDEVKTLLITYIEWKEGA